MTMRGLYRAAAMVMFGAAAPHTVPLASPTFNASAYPDGFYPAWRHLVFIARPLRHHMGARVRRFWFHFIVRRFIGGGGAAPRTLP